MAQGNEAWRVKSQARSGETIPGKTSEWQVETEEEHVRETVREEESDSDLASYEYDYKYGLKQSYNERFPSVMLSKFIKDESFPRINFDITNDYFSDLTSETLKYHMFVHDLCYLETFVKTLANEESVREALLANDGWEVLFQYSNEKSTMMFMTGGPKLFMEVVQAKNKVSFNIAADTLEAISEVREVADRLFPTPKVSKTAETIPVAFWSLAANGPAARNKNINPLYWNEITDNYTDTTVGGVDDLIKVRPPISGGRLILWHGEPGTGKSSAIRSLMHTWLPWCNASYVVDPEAFFGSANYMLSVLLDRKDEAQYDYEDDDDEDDKESSALILQGSKRWNLLVIEDADEFLQADAKQRTGQALSRLLNLADGLIGQGLNFLVLITTNELLKNIHAAVQREGRCLSVNEFHKFERDAAKRWLGDDAHALNAKRYANETTFSLAQLYDMQRETQQIKEDKPDLSIGVYL